ncbi:MAG TPA: pilin [Candidatus Paceibacterota bacterium]|nr:pilin [Candidatus Paceibacterota bacterium]
MNRLRAFLLLALLASALVPVPLYAQSGFPLFDPEWHLVPDAHELDSSCPEGAPLAFGAVLQLIQNVMNLAVALTALILIFVIVYAGALFMTSVANAEARSQAKSTLKNALVGFIIVIAAWLVIDAVMKVLYVGQTGENPSFLPWNKVFVGGSACVKVDTNQKSLFGNLNRGQVPQTTGSTGGLGRTLPGGGPVNTGYGKCSPSAITAAAAAGGYRLTTAEANTFSCLAVPESSCGTNTSIPRTPSGSPTTARGMFQIVLGYNDKCHNLNLPVCSTAAQKAGWSGSGNLNCSTAFSGGRVKPGMEELARICTAAAWNLDCNASAAACLMKADGGFNAWKADSRSSVQTRCIAQYGT